MDPDHSMLLYNTESWSAGDYIAKKPIQHNVITLHPDQQETL